MSSNPLSLWRGLGRGSSYHGNTDSSKCYQHGNNAHGIHLLPQRDPCHQGSSQRSQRHEELAVTRTYNDITLKKAEIANNVAYQS